MNDKILDSFLENVLKEAQESYQRNIQELDKLQSKNVEKAEDEILNDIYQQIQSNINNIKNDARRKISEKTAQSRCELLKRREEITKQVFDSVKAKLENFTESAEYTEFLKKILADFEKKSAVIYCRKCDIDKIKELGFDKVTEDDSIKIGGAVIEKNQSVRINQTLDVRLEEQYENFNLISGLSIV